MIGIVLIAAELLALWLLTRQFSQNLYISFFLVTRSRPFSVGLLSLIFFPGTVVHELAHLFVAEALGVRTGGLTLVPEAIENPEVRTGSVLISQTDPIRRAIIGVAPVFVGMTALFTIVYFIPGFWDQAKIDIANGIAFSQPSLYALLGLLYAAFAVSNTMFSSPEDMDGFWPVAIVLILLGGGAYFAGVRIGLSEDVMARIMDFVGKLSVTVGYIVMANVGLFALSKGLIAATQKFTGRRFVTKT
jgi:hypothetical protein